MSVTIRDIPQKVTMSGWGNTVVINNGPSVIYVGEDSSINVDQGVPLYPQSSMLWQDTHELWAVTQTGMVPSEVVVNRAGTAPANLDTFRTSILATPRSIDDLSATAPMYVGIYSTITIKWKANRLNPVPLYSDFVTAICYWSDGKDSKFPFPSGMSDQERVTTAVAWDMQGWNYLELPVLGEYCRLEFLTFDEDDNIEVIVSGSTRQTSNVSSSACDRPVRSTGNPNIFWSGDKTAYVTGWNGFFPIFLPSVTGTLNVTLSLPGTFSITDSLTFAYIIVRNSRNIIVGSMRVDKVASETGNLVYTGRMNIPTGEALRLEGYRGFLFPVAGINLSLSWE